jgi:hypothetical protein
MKIIGLHVFTCDVTFQSALLRIDIHLNIAHYIPKSHHTPSVTQFFFSFSLIELL